MASSATQQSQKRASDSPLAGSPQEKKTKNETGEEKTFLDRMGTEMADLYVGKEKKLFRVYKTLLCDKIPYFDQMFRSGFKESTEGSAMFPDDSIQSFDLLLAWIYTDSLRPFKWIARIGSENGGSRSVGNWSFEKMYVLLDKLCLCDLKDQIMTMIIGASLESNILPDFPAIQAYYRSTGSPSTLRKYSVNAFAYIMHGLSRKSCHLSIWPNNEAKEVLREVDDLLVDYLELIRTHAVGSAFGDPRGVPPCTFHEHGDDKACSVKT